MNDRSYCTKYYLFSNKKQLATLNNIQVLLKSVLIDLCACNFVHTQTFLHTCCVHACHHAHNLLSTAYLLIDIEFAPYKVIVPSCCTYKYGKNILIQCSHVSKIQKIKWQFSRKNEIWYPGYQIITKFSYICR